MSVRHVEAEGELAVAVFTQAFIDAFGGRTDRHWSSGTRADRLQARQFLTAARGEWADARAAWAGLVGIDSDVVRAQALRDAAAFDAWIALGMPEGQEPRWCWVTHERRGKGAQA
jgi:hypothetical protein